MFPVVRWRTFGNIGTASSRLRAFIPIRILSARGWNAGLYANDAPDDAEVVVFQKAYSLEDLQIAKEVKERGKAIIFDLCDNHFYNPAKDPVVNQRIERLETMIGISDSVVVSTPELQKYIQHPHVSIIDDAVENQKLNFFKTLYYRLFRSIVSNGKASLVWFGNSGSELPRFGLVDLELIVPILNELNAHCPIRLNVISDSKKAFNKHLSRAIFETHFIKWEQESFPYFFVQNDLCVIPISQNPFTICKTNNRIILALQLGLPVVTDRIPSYEEFSPFIAFSDWKENIARILSDNSIKKVMDSARTYIHQQYTDGRVYDQWSKVLCTTLARKRQEAFEV